VLLLGGVIAAVAFAAVLVVIATTRPPAAYPAGSPEAAFQAYLRAWEADDTETVHAAFSDRIRAEFPLARYHAMLADYGWARADDRRVVLVASRVDGDDATLDLRVDQFAEGGGMGGDVVSWEASVRLVHEDGTWHVDELLAGLEPMWPEE
jgi:hypothetical protein